MRRKPGGFARFWGRGSSAGSQSITMWPGPRPTRMPSFILIHPTIWPQYTNVTDRQTGHTDRQRSDSIGRTVLQTVAQKRFALCYRTIVLSCLSVCNVDVLLPSGCMDQNETCHGGRLGPGHIVLHGDPAPPKKGAQPHPPPKKKLAHVHCQNGWID